jgi:hypothetical protein
MLKQIDKPACHAFTTPAGGPFRFWRSAFHPALAEAVSELPRASEGRR